MLLFQEARGFHKSLRFLVSGNTSTHRRPVPKLALILQNKVRGESTRASQVLDWGRVHEAVLDAGAATLAHKRNASGSVPLVDDGEEFGEARPFVVSPPLLTVRATRMVEEHLHREPVGSRVRTRFQMPRGVAKRLGRQLVHLLVGVTVATSVFLG